MLLATSVAVFASACSDRLTNPLEPVEDQAMRAAAVGKVTVCHIAPGGGSAQLISVAVTSVQAHVAHGDALAACLIITEVMYNPPGSDTRGEYVELYNPSDEPVDLRSTFFIASSLKITDESGSLPDYFKDLANTYPLTVPGNGFAVVYDNGSSGSTVPSDYVIPASAVQATVDDAAIGNGLNNTGDSVILSTPDLGVTIDLMSYDGSLANGNGLSLQRCGTEFIEADPTPGAPNACP